MSPISSRNKVPPSDCPTRPRRAAVAPVKAPRSCPNNSDSNRSRGIAAVLRAMKGLSARGLWRCSARATSSLPVPDSPLMSTEIFERESRPIARNTSCIAGASPMISEGLLSVSYAGAVRRWCWLDARRAVERLEHAGGAVEGDHVHLGLFQCLFEHPADGTVVVDVEDAISAVHGASLAVDKWLFLFFFCCCCCF